MAGNGWKITAGISALGAAAAGGLAAHFATQLAMPKTFTLEEEKKWEQEKGLWGDFDSFERTPFTFQGKNGYVLRGEYVEMNPGSRKMVILTHGYTSNRYGSVKYLGVYRNLGFNAIIYDCRGHGENPRTACTVGNYEALDLLHLIEDVYERYGSDIELGLHGESMGSSTSLSVLKYLPRVKFVVADCGFANLYDLMGTLYRQRHVGFLLKPVNLAMQMKYGFDMRDTSARDALKVNEVPICLIHGLDDTFISPDNSDILAASTCGYFEVHKVEGAEHARCRYVLGEEKYTQIVREFLENIEKKEIQV